MEKAKETKKLTFKDRFFYTCSSNSCTAPILELPRNDKFNEEGVSSWLPSKTIAKSSFNNQFYWTYLFDHYTGQLENWND